MVSLVTRPCLLHETSNCPAQCTNIHPPLLFGCNTHPPLLFWRNEGTAGRVTAILPAGGLLSPCDAGSRWSRFALTSEDVGRVITTTAGGVSSTTVLSVNGFQRTVVLDAVLMSAVGTTSGPFLICYVQDERVGANVNITIASTCSAGPNVTIANPAVEVEVQLSLGGCKAPGAAHSRARVESGARAHVRERLTFAAVVQPKTEREKKTTTTTTVYFIQGDVSLPCSLPHLLCARGKNFFPGPKRLFSRSLSKNDSFPGPVFFKRIIRSHKYK